MSTAASPERTAAPLTTGSTRAEALATRLERGAAALAACAAGLTAAEWQTPVPHDGRRIGVIVHHVASVYPIEVELATTVASGQPVVGVTMSVIHEMNARHADGHAEVTQAEALDLLRRNSAAAAAGIRALTDAELDTAAAVSLYEDAPLTSQFVLEDHAVRHSYHHLALIKAALGQ
ncbi:MAG: DinB family protein [Vicinamibacterales bacterium]